MHADHEHVGALSDHDLRSMSFELGLKVQPTGKCERRRSLERRAHPIAERIELQGRVDGSKEVPLIIASPLAAACWPVGEQFGIQHRTDGEPVDPSVLVPKRRRTPEGEFSGATQPHDAIRRATANRVRECTAIDKMSLKGLEDDVRDRSQLSLASALVVTLLLIDGPSAAQTREATTLPFEPPTKCGAPASIVKSAIGLPEARAVGNAGVWALFFNPLSAKRRVKIVWRMTGSGQFRVVAYNPKGTRIEPDEGPVFHPSSNWQRSGEEWGTWFTFPDAGCWDLHPSRDGSSADLWVEVK
jgi:hypothetical protein